jgi:hypothetical protein
LWLRSYHASDVVAHLTATGRLTTVGSLNGHVYVGQRQLRPRYVQRYGGFGWRYENKTPDASEWSRSIRRADVLVPYSDAITVVAIVAFLPWLKANFSLRTLILATALTAIFLSMIVRTN